MNNQDSYYNQLLNQSGQIYTVFVLVPLVFGLYYYKNFTKPLKVFFAYLFVNFLLNLLVELFIWSVNMQSHFDAFWKPILAFTKIEDTNFFNGFSYFASFLFIGWFFYLIMKKSKYSSLLKWICIALCFFEVFNCIFIDGFRSKGAIGQISSTFYIIFLTAFYLLYLSNNPPDLSIWKNSYFWISISLFVVSTISFVYSFLAESIYESDFVLYCKIKIIRNGVNILSEIAFILAFFKSKYLKFL